MFMKLASTTAITAAVVAMTATGAAAQQAESPQNQETTESCQTAMNDFAQRMNEDEFWLSGWGTGGYGMRPAADDTMATVPEAGVEGGAGTTGDSAGATMDPRGEMAGMSSPRHQIRTLYSAANVLAQREDTEGCEYLVAKMNEVYDSYSQQLQDAGVDPASVTSWRQEQLAMAQPLEGSESASNYRIDNITGTDVRNPQDENLGSVSDVIIDPQSGGASYVIVARGGFLGMGEEHYAIPWDEVSATPGLDTIVINRTEAELEQAPAIDPDRFRNPDTMMDERQTTDEFWGQRG